MFLFSLVKFINTDYLYKGMVLSERQKETLRELNKKKRKPKPAEVPLLRSHDY